MVIVCGVCQTGLTVEYLLTFHKSLGLCFGRYCSSSCESQRIRELAFTAFGSGMAPSALQRHSNSHMTSLLGLLDK